MSVSGEPLTAQKMLGAAKTMLSLVRTIEKEKTGKHPSIPWQVDIFTGHSCCHIVIRHDGKEHGSIALETVKIALNRIRG